ncbi:MAG: hypothetical protein M1542_08565 [Thermotogae bacterium]|jgi:hypothetical protein|nr:hypothetical protein [Thermotogota bacterium]
MLNLNDKNEYIDTIVDEDTTSNNTPNTIVQRDSNGNFSAGTITANLSGTASNASQLSNMSATNANTASTIVQRDSSGNFSAGTITATLSGNAATASKWASPITITLTGPVTGSASVDGSANVSIATSATPADTTNTPNTIVERDSNGNFAAGTITASLNGTAAYASELSNTITIALTGAVVGSASTNGNSSVSIATTMADSGVTAGTYTQVTVNAAGLVTSASTPTTTITAAGAVTGSVSFTDGESETLTLTMANSGVTAGTYNQVTVNSAGLITSAQNVPGSYLLESDDTQVSTTATTATAMKQFRMINLGGAVQTLTVYVSAWNSSSSGTTTVGISLDGGTAVTATTSSTTETILGPLTVSVPSGNTTIHTVTVQLSTSNASYTAYTQMLQVLG